MKGITPAVLVAALFFNSCATTSKTAKTKTNKMTATQESKQSENPLMRKSSLQFEAPEFDKIKTEHFRPAFDFGLKQHNLEIQSIADNPQPATFANTLEALEKSGEVLKRAQIIFGNLTSADTNPELQALEEEYASIFAAHNDKIYLNENLYKRIKSISPQGLDAESKRLLEVYLQNFEIAGAGLSTEAKEELKNINQELATLSTQFDSKLLEARKNGALLISDVKELDGLSQDQISAAANAAKKAGHQGYLLSLQNTTQQPLLSSLNNRKTREKFFKASWLRAEKGDSADTREVVEKLAALRLKKANLLGKKSFAK